MWWAMSIWLLLASCWLDGATASWATSAVGFCANAGVMHTPPATAASPSLIPIERQLRIIVP